MADGKQKEVGVSQHGWFIEGFKYYVAEELLAMSPVTGALWARRKRARTWMMTRVKNEARWIARNLERTFQVAGHTDNIPIKSQKFRSNWDLSTARAVEVVNFMISAGLDGKRLSAAGYADMSPVAPNDTPENKAKNRRIEITLVPNLDDLPPIDDALKDNPPPAATPTPAAAPKS